MKITKTILPVLLFLLFSGFSNEGIAQKKVRVKKHRTGKVVVHHHRHRRPVKVRRVAHYRYRHLPGRGRVVASVGKGFVSVQFRGVGYRFHKGVYYRPRSKKFIVVSPPRGLRIRTLPVGYTRIVAGPRTYYYYYGTFYVPSKGDAEEYEVVAAPIGAVVDALPEGYEEVTVAGQEYYLLDGFFYEPRINDEGDEYYVVVNDPKT